MKYCAFHSCQYGGDRKKRTMFSYSHRAFAHINLKCPGVSSSHRRKPWGKIDKRFATAEETAYPFGLAMCIAHAFVIELCQAGMVPPPDMLSEVTQSSAQVLQSIRAATGSQPKAFVLPPIAPEFAATIQVSGPSRLLPSTALNSRLTADFTTPPYVASPIPIIPKYAKLVSLTARQKCKCKTVSAKVAPELFSGQSAAKVAGQCAEVSSQLQAASVKVTQSLAESGKGWQESAAFRGVVINLAEMHLGKATVDNTESRKPELSTAITDILDSGSLSKQGALQLRGRQFSAGQFYGRVARACLGAITRHAYDSVNAALPPAAMLCLGIYKEILLKPRVLSMKNSDAWMFFTDACYEPDAAGPYAGLGGVLVDPSGQIQRYFSHHLAQEHLRLLNPRACKTLIFECEFLAVLVALCLWGALVSGAQVLFFIDNNAVRDNLISCHSNNEVGRCILQRVLSAEQSYSINAWFSRVPSPSNIADEASRNDLKRFVDLGCQRDRANLDEVLRSLALKRGEEQAS
eukprot:Skav206673  [mRNA]  locus=scaffold1895:44960:47487:- [translate_table: standard]